MKLSPGVEHVNCRKLTKSESAEDRASELRIREVMAQLYGVARVAAGPVAVTHSVPTSMALTIEYAVNTI